MNSWHCKYGIYGPSSYDFSSKPLATVTHSFFASFSLDLSQWQKKAGEIKNWGNARQPLVRPQVGKPGAKAVGGSICCVREELDKAAQHVSGGDVPTTMSGNYPNKEN